MNNPTNQQKTEEAGANKFIPKFDQIAVEHGEEFIGTPVKWLQKRGNFLKAGGSYNFV